MNLPSIRDLNVQGKRVLLRLDLDVSVKDGKIEEDYRLQAAIPTIKLLLERESGQIVVLGHRGRPEGKIDESLSLTPVSEYLEQILKEEIGEAVEKLDIFVMENLRFDAGEEENSLEFAKELASKGDIYINDAFASCHREDASIVGLPKLLPHAAGLHLLEEVENLGKVLENPKPPVVFVLGGGKLDKVLMVDKLLNHADWVLAGGVLPQKIKSYCRESDGKMCVSAAHLTPEAKDITPDSARNFAEIITKAGTIVWNGPMGDIDNGFWEGTEIIAEAIADSSGYKIVGGGDTVRALQKLGFLEKMDYVSTGGGAMLEFLAYGDLPGLKALRNR